MSNWIIGVILLSFFPIGAAIAYYNENKPYPEYEIQPRRLKVIARCIAVAIGAIIVLLLFSLMLQGFAMVGFWDWHLAP